MVIRVQNGRVIEVTLYAANKWFGCVQVSRFYGLWVLSLTMNCNSQVFKPPTRRDSSGAW